MRDEKLIALGSGMKSSYLGGFTNQEVRFLNDIYDVLNSYTACYPSSPKGKLVHGGDLHLFSGSSKIGTTRVDISPNSNANVHMTVQEFFKKNTKKYELIIIDPPYNLRYDTKYGTASINKDVGNAFVEWLVKECVKILLPGGIIVSKNWRSIATEGLVFLAGIVTFYGTRRRITIFEAWQKAKNPSEQIMQKFNAAIASQDLSFVNWEFGGGNEFRPMLKWVDEEKLDTENSAFVVDKGTPMKYASMMSLDAFLATRKKFSLISIDECTGIGGSVPKTNALKERIVSALPPGGIVAMKTYFNPVMEEEGLKLLERQVVLYKDQRTISLLSIYQKPMNFRRQATF